MEEKEATLVVTNTMSGEPESLQMNVRAKITENLGKIEIVMDVSKIILQGKIVRLITITDFENELLIEKNSPHDCLYKTSQGEIVFTVLGKNICLERDENGLSSLYLAYYLFSGANKISQNTVSVVFNS